MTIFRPITPLTDENLAGLVARAAGANAYTHAHDILVLAGLGDIRPETIAGKSPDTADVLAEVLGTEPALVRGLYQRRVDDRQIDFFGANLRAIHRETRLRRVSPRSLRNRGYIKAIWSVRPLTFDPETRETLISHCPVCGGKLGYTKTWGVEFCEHCVEIDQDGLPTPVVDLRDYPQPLVEVDDEEGLDFVVSLLDPHFANRSASGLHDDLVELGRGELFELAVALATAIVADELGLPVTVT